MAGERWVAFTTPCCRPSQPDSHQPCHRPPAPLAAPPQLGAGAKTAAPAPPQDNASVEATAEEEEGAAEPGLLAPMGPEEPGPQGAGLYDDDEEEEEEGEDVAAMDPFLMPSRMLKRTRAIRVQMKKGGERTCGAQSAGLPPALPPAVGGRTAGTLG